MSRLAPILTVMVAIWLPRIGHAQQPKGDQVPNGLKALFHSDPKVRYNSAAILGRLGKVSRFAVPYLVKALKDKDGFVRLKVAEALWKIDPKLALYIVPVLRSDLRDKSAAVRIAASKLVAQMGADAKPLLSYLSRNLRDEDLVVRMETILTLDRLGPAAAATANQLLQLHKEKDIVVLEPMISVTLGSLGKGATPALTNALGDSNVAVRRMAAYGLGLIGRDAKRATSALTKVLQKDSADVKALAAKALGRIGADAKSAVPVLTSALKDDDANVRINAALAIYRVNNSQQGVATLTELSTQISPIIRIGVCRAIGKIGKDAKSVQPTLLKLLADESAGVRIAAIEAMSKTGPGDDGLVAFINALQDKNSLVRVVAARALSKSGDERAIRVAMPFLKESLGDKYPDVRLQAVRALAEIGPAAKVVFKELALLLEDADAEVQRATREALKRIDAKAAAGLGVR